MLKLRKRTISLLVLILVIVLAMTSLPVAAVSVNEELVSILIYEDGETSISVSVYEKA